MAEDDDEDGDDEAVLRTRSNGVSHVARAVKRRRKLTVSAKSLTRDRIRQGWRDVGGELSASRDGTLLDERRPRTWGECRETNGRPCPWLSCKHHLYLDVVPETGSIIFNFPDLEPWELVHTCSLDVAARGGLNLEDVGEVMNLTRERVRQIEVRALTRKMYPRLAGRGFEDEDD